MGSNKFWEVDNLLMSNELVSCIAETDIFGLDLGDKSKQTSGGGNAIVEGSKLEVPLWFGLILRKINYVSIKQPKYLTDKFYNQLQADPVIVSFKNKNPFIYDICMQLIPYLDDDQKWPKCLAETLYKRFLHLLKNSSNVIYENEQLLKLLSWKEKNFYDKTVKINKNVKFYLENYENNNKLLDDIIEAKKNNQKRKKNK
jgi:hypothetical protein